MAGPDIRFSIYRVASKVQASGDLLLKFTDNPDNTASPQALAAKVNGALAAHHGALEALPNTAP